MENDPLLQPFSIRHVRFRNRIMSTSHACGLEEDGGMPAETYQRYHQEKAKGGLGLTMFGGSSYVDADSTWKSGQLNMSTDRIIPYLQSFSERIHSEGAALMIQLTHLGRRGEPNTINWLSTIGPSVVRETGHRSFPKQMDKFDINRVVKAFGAAALRAKQGDLDGMETMIGGHLIGQFLSPMTNKRTDKFGGSLENRCRFGLLVHEEIRNRVGDDFIVGMRFPIDEAVQGGMDFDECIRAANIFQRSGLIDFFNANYGRIDTELKLLIDCMPAMASPIAPWLQIVGAFKKEVKLPVFHAARITDLATARYAIQEGLLDMVAMTRAHIADPHIVNKIISGDEDRIRPCVGMTHCMGDNRPTCLHNPATARERFWPQIIQPGAERKKCMVVGGGPTGLEAARILAQRGHEVTLMEATKELGGQLRLACKAHWRKDVIGIIDWRISELEKLGATVKTDFLAAESDIINESPDLVIIATGGLPDLDWLPGNQFVTSVNDLLTGNVPVGDSVIVYDGTGRHPGLTVADYCNQLDKLEHLVLLDTQPGAELDYGEQVIWRRELALTNIQPKLEFRLISVRLHQDRLQAYFVHELSCEEMILDADQIVVEHGTKPVEDLFQSLQPHSANNGVTDIAKFLSGEPQSTDNNANGFELHRIGDALSSRNVAAAMFDALRLCSVM